MRDPNLRLCVTCKHHEVATAASALHYCTKDVPPADFSPVTGAGWTSPKAMSCSIKRILEDDDCGPTGKCYVSIYNITNWSHLA